MTRQAIAADFGLPEPGPTGPKYPDVTVRLTGNDGNAFAIIGNVARHLRRAHGAKAADAYRNEAMKQDSYDALLRFTMQTVEVL